MHLIHLDELTAKPKSLRKQIIENSDGTCSYCGVSLFHNEITLDHIVPKSKGGATSIYNLAVCCYTCNQNKKDSDVWEWWQRQSFFNWVRAEKLVRRMDRENWR